ncbi:MAG: MBL fold metallo-hydrolase [Oscillospiraceae bacterium]|nr:MBL fold metallo-hydrolase [Oscillospiraceae bacterium]
MSRIYPLFSSSKGNCTYIGTKEAGVLIDCGVTFTRLRYALDVNGLSADAIKAVFITHEHCDHISGLRILTKYTGAAVFAQAYTLEKLNENGHISRRSHAEELRCGVEVCGMSVEAFDTPHDTRESCGYKLTFSEGKVCAVCTDLGHVSETVERFLLGADVVLLESNYDEALLIGGRYPWFLKKRILSKNGHLSNADCSDFAARLIKSGTTRLILGHLSLENNTPQAAAATAEKSLREYKQGRDYILSIAPVQTTGGFIAF